MGTRFGGVTAMPSVSFFGAWGAWAGSDVAMARTTSPAKRQSRIRFMAFLLNLWVNRSSKVTASNGGASGLLGFGSPPRGDLVLEESRQPDETHPQAHHDHDGDKELGRLEGVGVLHDHIPQAGHRGEELGDDRPDEPPADRTVDPGDDERRSEERRVGK